MVGALVFGGIGLVSLVWGVVLCTGRGARLVRQPALLQESTGLRIEVAAEGVPTRRAAPRGGATLSRQKCDTERFCRMGAA